MAEVDVNKIQNIIADIQTSQENLEKAIKDRDSLQRQLEDEEMYISDEQQNIRSLRDELDAYLDELIPDTNSESDRRTYDYAF